MDVEKHVMEEGRTGEVRPEEAEPELRGTVGPGVPVWKGVQWEGGQ